MGNTKLTNKRLTISSVTFLLLTIFTTCAVVPIWIIFVPLAQKVSQGGFSYTAEGLILKDSAFWLSIVAGVFLIITLILFVSKLVVISKIKATDISKRKENISNLNLEYSKSEANLNPINPNPKINNNIQSQGYPSRPVGTSPQAYPPRPMRPQQSQPQYPPRPMSPQPQSYPPRPMGPSPQGYPPRPMGPQQNQPPYPPRPMGPQPQGYPPRPVGSSPQGYPPRPTSSQPGQQPYPPRQNQPYQPRPQNYNGPNGPSNNRPR